MNLCFKGWAQRKSTCANSRSRVLCVRVWRCRFVLQSLTHRLTDNVLNFFAQTWNQGLRMLQDKLPYDLPQTPLKDQVHPLQHTLHHLLLKLCRSGG